MTLQETENICELEGQYEDIDRHEYVFIRNTVREREKERERERERERRGGERRRGKVINF